MQARAAGWRPAVAVGGVVLLALLALWSLNRGLVNHDVAGHLVAAELILSGQSLYTSFLDMNPPLVLYFYVPPVWVAELTGLALPPVFRLWVLLVAGLTLGLDWRLLRVLQRPWLLFGVSGWAVLWLPGADFGQREHLHVMLVLPYLFAATATVAGIGLPLTLRVAAGTCGALGLCIKPHFLLVWVMVEAAVVLGGRHNGAGAATPERSDERRPAAGGPASLLRLENRIIAAFLVFYGLLVLVASPGYLGRVVPMLVETYWAFNAGWERVILQPWMLLVPASVVVFVSVGRGPGAAVAAHGNGSALQEDEARHNSASRFLEPALFFWMVATLIIYLVQKKGWSYHSLPVITTSILFLVVSGRRLVGAMGTRQAGVNQEMARLDCRGLSRGGRWLGFAAVVVAGLAVVAGSKAAWDGHRRQQFRLLQGESGRLIELFRNEAADEPVMFLSSTVSWSMPAVAHSRARWGSSFPQLWPIPALYHGVGTAAVEPGGDPGGVAAAPGRPAYHSYEQASATERFVIDTLRQDLTRHRPRLILFQKGVYQNRFGGTPFDWQQYFASFPDLAAALASDYTLLSETRLHRIYVRR